MTKTKKTKMADANRASTVRIFKRDEHEVGVDVSFSELQIRFPNMPTEPGKALKYLYNQKTRRTKGWLRLMNDVSQKWSADLTSWLGSSRSTGWWRRSEGGPRPGGHPLSLPEVAPAF